MYLLDTNTVIYIMKGQYEKLTKRIFSHQPSDFAISSITLFELEYGAAKSKWGDKTREKLAMFLSPFTILPFDSEDASCAGQIRGYLSQQGLVIEPYDYQIAGQGLAKNMTVITHNTGEFSRVPGLKIEDWTI